MSVGRKRTLSTFLPSPLLPSNPPTRYFDGTDLISDYIFNKTTHFNEEEIIRCRLLLIKWYEENRRLLPWRGDTLPGFPSPPLPSPYGIWVSEIMLQQTRVDTVIKYWNKWMIKYPTIQDLATATPDEVNTLWSGLGYYSRAQRLLEGARKVVKEYNGKLPDTVAKLMSIPGIGPYTAGAISSIAYNKSEPLVDGNVIRVLTRLRGIKSELNNAVEKDLWNIATHLVDPILPGVFNQGLMELGATVCKPQLPQCDTCPLASLCVAKEIVARKNELLREIDFNQSNVTAIADIEDLIRNKLPKDVTFFPKKVAKKRKKDVILSVLVLAIMRNGPDVTQKDPAFLFIRRPQTGLLANQWELPNVVMKESNETDNPKDFVNIKLSREVMWEPFPSYLQEKIGYSWSEPYDPHSHTDVESTEIGESFRINENKPELPKIYPLANGCNEIMAETVVHVFSHQRHIMHVNVKQVYMVEKFNPNRAKDGNRDVRLMKFNDIEKVGLTAGMKKVLLTARRILDFDKVD